MGEHSPSKTLGVPDKPVWGRPAILMWLGWWGRAVDLHVASALGYEASLKLEEAVCKQMPSVTLWFLISQACKKKRSNCTFIFHTETKCTPHSVNKIPLCTLKILTKLFWLNYSNNLNIIRDLFLAQCYFIYFLFCCILLKERSCTGTLGLLGWGKVWLEWIWFYLVECKIKKESAPSLCKHWLLLLLCSVKNKVLLQ